MSEDNKLLLQIIEEINKKENSLTKKLEDGDYLYKKIEILEKILSDTQIKLYEFAKSKPALIKELTSIS